MPTPPLRHLTELPAPPRWAWAVGHPEGGGRVRLPAEAKAALGCIDGQRVLVRGRCHRIGLVLWVDVTAGAALKVDGAGRLMLPVWLRDVGSLIIGTDTAAGVVVVAPVVVLDPVGDLLARGDR